MEKLRLPSKIVCIEEKDNSAIFEIKPLFPGYGVTIGNALRRVLLSSLPGSAIIAIKMKGIDHEFTTAENLKEDIVAIILNVKKVRVKVHSEEPVRMSLKVSGLKEIKAGDIKCPSSVEILNKDQIIATLTDKKSKLEMEFIAEKGRGYIPVEQQEGREKEIGMLAIDAIYTPVERVSYKSENMRVGKMTNYNRLLLEVETDGSVSPREAISEAASILVDHFSPIIEEVREKLTERVEDKKEEVAVKTEEDAITNLKLPERIENALINANIKNVKELSEYDPEKLKTLPRIGEKAISDIKKSLKKVGLTLKETIEKAE